MTATLALPGTTASTRATELRDRGRQLLGALLNGEWATRGAMLVTPFGHTVRRDTSRAAAILAEAVGLSQVVAPRKVNAFERLLSQSWRQLPQLLAHGQTVSIEVPAAARGLRVLADPGFARLQAAAQRLCRDHGVRCLLHGSLATDDWTPYRDADLLLLVPPALLANPGRLAGLRRGMAALLRALYAFDPLQHHGVFAAGEEELAAWPEHWLPIDTLRCARDLGGDGLRLELRSAFDRCAARRQFAAVVDYFDRARIPRDAYGWKAFASVLMLVPALHRAARGTPCWKGASFAPTAELVPPALWEPQRWAARFRAEFRDPTPDWVRWLLRHAPEPRCAQQALRRLAQLPRDRLPPDPVGLLQQARALVQHLAHDLDPADHP